MFTCTLLQSFDFLFRFFVLFSFLLYIYRIYFICILALNSLTAVIYRTTSVVCFKLAPKCNSTHCTLRSFVRKFYVSDRIENFQQDRIWSVHFSLHRLTFSRLQLFFFILQCLILMYHTASTSFSLLTNDLLLFALIITHVRLCVCVCVHRTSMLTQLWFDGFLFVCIIVILSNLTYTTYTHTHTHTYSYIQIGRNGGKF